MAERRSTARRGNGRRGPRANRDQATAEEQLDPRTARGPIEREQARAQIAHNLAAERDAERIRNDQSASRPVAVGQEFVHSSRRSGHFFTIEHGGVGQYLRGQRVHVDDLGEDNIERLLALEAIRQSAETDEPNDVIPPAPRQTLAEAVRSESPPTLPYAPNVDATPEELRAAADPNTTFVTGPLPESNDPGDREDAREEQQKAAEDALEHPAGI